MNVHPRTIAWVGVLLIIVGLAGGVIGGHQLSSNRCVSGYRLSADRVPNSSAEANGTVNFSSLSPTDQRLFLEALTAPNDRSRTYGSTGTFSSVAPRRIVYREQVYVTNVLAVDCGTPSGLYPAIGGGVSLVLGLLFTLYASVQYRPPEARRRS